MNSKKTIFPYLFLTISTLNSCKNKISCQIPEEVTYSKQIKTIIETDCFLCHAQDVYKTKASRNKIFDYESLKKSGKSGVLIGSITHTKGYIAMPYKKGVKIDSCNIELIKKWVQTGMKN
ncbi:hypothetical protein D1816_00225 [Aquimarina sp. AD10]|uniref:Cytochrome c domain-containing protein n=1 Tax=Aquimarina aggregata TaxID=1642818 RepID=A0A162FDM9_9FLAO|nr:MULTISPECIES: hypothetical protein [Aquimarina]AXT58837.1 hypothetical protein D1816_00225 [Aquimarina sp. AD10]KZS41716.1 hypothetical protein AWE51_20175 [Aquimarina aggregata]RKM99687.1 hypothetical protein D7033_10990 [Aquimarina sp. AD10]